MAEEQLKYEFVPFGEQRQIVLTPSLVSDILAVRTKKGRGPSKADVRIFLERCAAQSLNPYTGDAFLIGYDNDDETATFSLITSHQALLKRAETHPQYDGLESGVIVIRRSAAPGAGLRDSKPTPEEIEAAKLTAKPIAEEAFQRPGELIYSDESLLGAWCRVYRKDRTRPSIAILNFSVYNTGYSRWKKDPGGMIVKCAEASGLREAFATTMGGLYIAQEMDALQHQTLGLPDNRVEQELNRIVIPSANKMSDDRREFVPASNVHEMPKTMQPAGNGSQSTDTGPGSSDTDRKSAESAGAAKGSEGDSQAPSSTIEPTYPEEIRNLLDAISRAKSEMSLLSIKQAWLQVKAKFPDMTEVVEGAWDRRLAFVPGLGEKLKP